MVHLNEIFLFNNDVNCPAPVPLCQNTALRAVHDTHVLLHFDCVIVEGEKAYHFNFSEANILKQFVVVAGRSFNKELVQTRF